MLKHSYKIKANSEEIQNNYYVYLSVKARCLLISIVVIYVFLVGVFNLSQMESSLSIIFFSLLGYISTLLLPLIFFQKNWGLFHPLVFLCIWTFFRTIVPSTLLYTNGLESHNALSEHGGSSLNLLVAKELWLGSLSILMIYIGYFLFKNINVPKMQIKEPKAVVSKLLVITLISTFAILIIAISMGGVGNLFLQRGMTQEMRAEEIIGGHWLIIARMLVPACLVAMVLKNNIIKNPFFLILFGYALVITFATNGSRSGVIIPFILFLIIWSIRNKKIPYSKFAIVAILAVVILGFLGNFREISSGLTSIKEVQFNTNIVQSLESGLNVFNSYTGETKGSYPVLEKAGDEVDLLYGKSYLAIIAAPIPRAIWPDKPQEAGKLVSTVFFGNPTSANPPGSIGEAYWNFHIFGVLIIFFIWGIFLKLLSSFYVRNINSKIVVPIYAITVLLLEPNGTAFYSWAFMIIPAIIFGILCFGVPSFSFKKNKRYFKSGNLISKSIKF